MPQNQTCKNPRDDRRKSGMKSSVSGQWSYRPAFGFLVISLGKTSLLQASYKNNKWNLLYNPFFHTYKNVFFFY